MGKEGHAPCIGWGANIGKFLNDVYSLVETKKTNDIVDITNQSSKEGIRIVLELRKGADKMCIRDRFCVMRMFINKCLSRWNIISHQKLCDIRSHAALEKYRKAHKGSNFTLQRYKGLGEMDR